MEIPFDYSIFSQMNINTNNIKTPGQWALEIASVMGADEYINPIGGYQIFNEKEFHERNIGLQFLKSNLTPYVQRRGYFVAGLSIVDVMMWNEKEKIQKMLNNYDIVTFAKLNAFDHE